LALEFDGGPPGPPSLLAQRGKLSQKMGVARIFGEQAFEFVAGLFPGHRPWVNAWARQKRRFRAFYYPIHGVRASSRSSKPVELVVFQVELSQPLDDAKLGVDLVGLLEGRAQEQFDGFFPERTRSARAVGERDQSLRFGRVWPGPIVAVPPGLLPDRPA